MLKIDRMEVVRGRNTAEALVSSGMTAEYRIGMELETMSMIGAEATLEAYKSGEMSEGDFIRVWVGDYPLVSVKRNPKSIEGMLGTGLVTVDADWTTNLIVKQVFGKEFYFSQGARPAPIMDAIPPDERITKDEFFALAYRRPQNEVL